MKREAEPTAALGRGLWERGLGGGGGAGANRPGGLGGGGAIWRATPEPAVLQEGICRELPIWQSASSIYR